jgi:hypothetical protein
VTRWGLLPTDCLSLVFKCLDSISLHHAEGVCKRFRSSMGGVLARRNLVCFFTRLPYTECGLGIPIICEYNKRNGSISQLLSTFEVMSHQAFVAGVRHTVWNRPFSHFLPLALNYHRFQNCSGRDLLLELCIELYALSSSVAAATAPTSTRPFTNSRDRGRGDRGSAGGGDGVGGGSLGRGRAHGGGRGRGGFVAGRSGEGHRAPISRDRPSTTSGAATLGPSHGREFKGAVIARTVETLTPTTSTPIEVADTLCCLLNSVIVSFMNKMEPSTTMAAEPDPYDFGFLADGPGTTRAASAGERIFHSEQALQGYCWIHHLWLSAAFHWPNLAHMANDAITKFLSGREHQTKHAVPDMGKFLNFILISGFTWKDVAPAVINEVFIRNVLWLIKDDASLENPDMPIEERLTKTFRGALTSLRLLMFQAFFLRFVGKRDGLSPFKVYKEYESTLGSSPPSLVTKLQHACKRIRAVDTWPEFFAACDLSCPTKPELHALFVGAIFNSSVRGYHTPSRMFSSRSKPTLKAIPILSSVP